MFYYIGIDVASSVFEPLVHTKRPIAIILVNQRGVGRKLSLDMHKSIVEMFSVSKSVTKS